MNCYKGICFAALSLALASCGGNTSSSQDSELDDLVAQTAASANEAAAAAKEVEELQRNRPASEPSASSSGIPTGGKPTNPEAENTVKAFINLNGELCAKIVSVRPLSMPNTAEVTCIEYTGGSNHVTYIINLESGALQKAG